ncbi:DUF4232 domain-containing protein [Saccharomonospora piscinae]|uniref:DUF4232 domain-containing protein n=1 Tax=Saccharomonospora piscinae TaxID=687388 RepID=UPI0011058993|nr:DUF4232 domain-containing protein [Saccharomonospora piscinae]TLW94700.1 DUF4232 domain-containing protein [Saccharomonospora piscinae]
MRTGGWVLFALPALLVLGACTGGPVGPEPAPPRTPEATVDSTCPDSGVRVTAGLDEAASGVRVQALRLTNCGDEPYRLDGYPVLRVLDAEGEPLDLRVLHGSGDIATIDGFDDPPRPLTLRSGESADTHLLWRNTRTGTGAPQVGERLSVAPAEGEPWQPVRFDGDRGAHLDLGTTGELGVRAWHRPQSP